MKSTVGGLVPCDTGDDCSLPCATMSDVATLTAQPIIAITTRLLQVELRALMPFPDPKVPLDANVRTRLPRQGVGFTHEWSAFSRADQQRREQPAPASRAGPYRSSAGISRPV